MYFGNLVCKKLTKSYYDDIITLSRQLSQFDYPEQHYLASLASASGRTAFTHHKQAGKVRHED